MLESTAAYRLRDFIGEEGPGKERANFYIGFFSLSIVRGNQGTRSCVLAQVLGNKVFPSGRGISTAAKHLWSQAAFKMAG
jgi:hypothetical protein